MLRCLCMSHCSSNHKWVIFDVWSEPLESNPETGIAWGRLIDERRKTWAYMDRKKAALSRGKVGVSGCAVNCSLSPVLWSWGGSLESSQTEETGLLLSIPAPVYFGPWLPLESCITLTEVVSPGQGHFPTMYTAAAVGSCCSPTAGKFSRGI